MNKAIGGDGAAELFQILKDDIVKMLHSVCQQIWKTQQGPWDWKRSGFIPIPKKGNAKECANYCTIALISHASKVMLKILKPGFSNTWTMNFQMFKLDLGKAEEIANICWIVEKARELQKNLYFCFIDYAKAFDCVDHNKLWNILEEMGITGHLYLPPEKREFRSRSNSQNRTWNNGLVPNWKRSTSRLYIVTLLI